MSIVDTIKLLANAKGISITVLEQTVGLGNGTIGKWRKQSPSCDKLKLVADYLSTTIDYLITGENKLQSIELTYKESELLDLYKKLSSEEQSKVLGRVELLAEQAEAERQKNKPAPKVKQSKPVIENTNSEDEEPPIITMHYYDNPASAGPGAELGDGRYSEMSVCQNTLTSKADIAIRVKGDSMEPAFYDGDIVLVRLTPSIEINEIGIFRVDNDYGYIKKKGCDRLISINPKCDDIPYSDDCEIVTIGRVIGKLSPDWIIA